MVDGLCGYVISCLDIMRKHYNPGITYMREASALLVQPVRAMRRPQQVERAISMGSHALFL